MSHVNRGGYFVESHRRSAKATYAHVAIVEAALGHSLPRGAVVHHVNTIKTDNVPTNLLALQSQREHRELHRKMRVRAAGGDPWRDRLCGSCGPRPTEEFYRYRDGRYCFECRPCARRTAVAKMRDRQQRIRRNT